MVKLPRCGTSVTPPIRACRSALINIRGCRGVWGWWGICGDRGGRQTREPTSSRKLGRVLFSSLLGEHLPFAEFYNPCSEVRRVAVRPAPAAANVEHTKPVGISSSRRSSRWGPRYDAPAEPLGIALQALRTPFPLSCSTVSFHGRPLRIVLFRLIRKSSEGSTEAVCVRFQRVAVPFPPRLIVGVVVLRRWRTSTPVPCWDSRHEPSGPRTPPSPAQRRHIA